MADWLGNRIRAVRVASTGTNTSLVTTLAGTGSVTLSDGNASTAGTPNPFALTMTPNGDLLFTDGGHTSIRKVSRNYNTATP